MNIFTTCANRKCQIGYSGNSKRIRDGPFIERERERLGKSQQHMMMNVFSDWPFYHFLPSSTINRICKKTYKKDWQVGVKIVGEDRIFSKIVPLLGKKIFFETG